ncbi:UPF0149 family protein [Psychromonas sp. SP041]|uniref:UPF0149 family protein n=1 Tax=Psychromonas sp. SP041 TaxID=1365007 RepID=UPI000471564D|nr:UPF0149 family protein [Psychromonas sp. SP041]
MPDHLNNVFMDFITFNENHKQSVNLHTPYYQLGFICSVQALPELVDLEQWLSYLWLDGVDISFDNELQAAEYAKKVLTLVSEIQNLYQQAIPLDNLNSGQWLTEQETVTEHAIQFATGFLVAIELFNDQWVLVEQDFNTQNILQTTILLLSKLAPADNIDQQHIELLAQLPEPVEILRILPQLLSNLAYNAGHSAAQNAPADL